MLLGFETRNGEYDGLHRLLGRIPDERKGEMAIRFGYTATGKRACMTDGHGRTDYAYDVRDRLTMKASPIGVLNYRYDERGNLTRLYSNTPNGADLTYQYDALSRLEHAIDARGGTTDYRYDAVSKLTGYTYPNGVATNHAFDALDRLLEVRQTKNDNTLGGVAYRLSASGQRLGIDDLIGGTKRSYVYDDLYRLRGETIADDQTHNGGIGYLHDKVGNRLLRQSTVPSIAPQTFGYDANDRISISDFDSNGNTITFAGQYPNEQYVDEYDFEDRLIRRTSNQRGIIAEFAYDGDGNRISETVNGETTEFLVDTQNPTRYAQVVEEHKVGALRVSYAYALDLIAQHDETTTGTVTHYFGYDGLGTTRMLTDAAGNVTDCYWYDAFGTMLRHDGTTETRYLYTGEQYDVALGMYYLRARWLDTASARFASGDKIMLCTRLLVAVPPGILHLYGYAGQSPALRVDPSGYFPSLNEKLVSLAIRSVMIVAGTTTVGGLGGAVVGLASCRQGPQFAACFCEKTLSGAAVGLVAGLAYVIGQPASLSALIKAAGTAAETASAAQLMAGTYLTIVHTIPPIVIIKYACAEITS